MGLLGFVHCTTGFELYTCLSGGILTWLAMRSEFFFAGIGFRREQAIVD